MGSIGTDFESLKKLYTVAKENKTDTLKPGVGCFLLVFVLYSYRE